MSTKRSTQSNNTSIRMESPRLTPNNPAIGAVSRLARAGAAAVAVSGSALANAA